MDQAVLNSYQSGPDEDGRFGIHGGRFVAETLMPLILSVESAYRADKTILSSKNSFVIIKHITLVARHLFILQSV